MHNIILTFSYTYWSYYKYHINNNNNKPLRLLQLLKPFKNKYLFSYII